MRLLIIDDEPHIRQMMRLTLEPTGHRVDEAATGEEGLARFGDGHDYDAVLLDQKMPGLDGLLTLRHLRERDAGARVIVATAFAVGGFWCATCRATTSSARRPASSIRCVRDG